MEIEEASIADHQELTALTIRSKSFWGYSSDQMEEWRDDLTVAEEYITNNQVLKLLVNKQLIGYCSYAGLDRQTVKLDNLFIEPSHIRKGYGKYLVQYFIDYVKMAGYKKITLDADPNAEPFYKDFDFIVVGKLESSIRGRYLPIMEKVL